jgi:hypothetical protein
MSFKLVTAFVFTLGVMEAPTAVSAALVSVPESVGMLLASTNV